MAYALALAMGRIDVDEMLNEMTASQLTGWQAYYQLEPFCGQRGDLQAAVVASTIANVNRGKNQKPFTPLDFMAYCKQYTKKPSLRERLMLTFKRRMVK